MLVKTKDAKLSNSQPGSIQAVSFISALVENLSMTSISVCTDVWRMSALTPAPLSAWLTYGYSLFVILIKLQSLSSITVKCQSLSTKSK